MKEIVGIVNNYNVEIILGLVGFTFLMFIFNLSNRIKISKITSKYNKLVNGSDKNNVEDLLMEVNLGMDKLTNEINITQRDIKELENKSSFAIQKLEAIRYDAFDEMGSEQSFSVAMLDDHNTGVIITNIFGRDYNSSFIKPIKKGIPDYKLSVEETQVLDRATKDN